MKSIPLICLLTLWVAGCSNPDFHDKPSEQTCIKWLTGQKVVLDKGVFLDNVWTIEASEFRSFTFQEIRDNSNGSKSAFIRFELQAGAKHLVVEGALVYRLHRTDKLVEYVSFKPSWILKKGAW